METEFIYWRHPSIPGIKIEEVCGAQDKKGKVWREMAFQVYCENGKDGFRELGHFRNGAPFIFGEENRISVSHTEGMLVVATLPATPEIDLSEFSLRAAMGVDVERADRDQVLRIREKFLSSEERGEGEGSGNVETGVVIPPDDVRANIIAWTAKEACYKAVLGATPDFAKDIHIVKLPELGPAVPVYNKEEFPEIVFGKAIVRMGITKEERKEEKSEDVEEVELTLYTFESEGYIITLAYSPKCAKFGKTL